MKYVVDASIGFKWEVVEQFSDKAGALRVGFHNAVHELLAPDIFPTEVANAILVAERRGRVPAGKSLSLLIDFLTTQPKIHAALPVLLPRAYVIATQTRASIYDCLYVALAELENCQLVTADDKLVRNLQALFPFVVPLSSLP
ncbi:MAG: type II toxin-antitoxin system VapC family toxin [Pirellulales bacterium]